jgi:hypothetical protein
MENHSRIFAISYKIKQNLGFWELGIIAITTALFIVNWGNHAMLNAFLTLFCVLIATMYYFTAYTRPAEDKVTQFEIFALRTSGLASSVAYVGLLFFARNWPGGFSIVFASAIALLVSFVGVLVFKDIHPKSKAVSRFEVLRLIVLLFLTVKIVSAQLFL